MNKTIPVTWAFDTSKTANGTIDFTVGAKSYKSGAFIIPVEFAAEALPTLNTWKAGGVIIDGPTTTGFTVPVFSTLTSYPRVVLDKDKGSLTAPYFAKARIPTTAYRFATPAQITPCDDLFVLPHADPTWTSHGNLKTFNDAGGFIWAACHAVSVLENVDSPDPGAAPNLNFLSTDGLVPFGDHDDGSPAYTYQAFGNPAAQFLGILDNATLNGSEQIYLPARPGSWRPTTQILTYDPTHVDVGPGKPSSGPAAVLAVGPGFGNPNNGYVMYEGGHTHDGTDPANVAAMRAFFNLQLLAGVARSTEISTTMPTTINAATTVPMSASVTGGSTPYTYQWSSTCGGTFSAPTGASTNFTAPSVVAPTDCRLKVVVTDACGRVNFRSTPVVIAPASRADVRLAKTVDDATPVEGQTVEFTITATNPVGPDAAQGVQVAETLPAGLTFVSATPSSGTTFAAGTWTIGTLAVGGTATLIVRATVDAGRAGQTLTNTASATSTSTDPTPGNNIAQSSITVNRLPVATDDAATTAEDSPVNISVLANDSVGDGPVAVTSFTQPAHGTVTIDATTGVATYTPDANYTGTDTFTYTITDANGDTSTATVTITITPIADGPVATTDTETTPEDTPIVIDVLANDSDPENDIDRSSLTVLSVPQHGTVVILADGTIRYTPDPNYNGPDSFTYQICDSNTPKLCANAPVNITVTPVNDVPVASPDSSSTPEDTPVTMSVLANDTDPDPNLDLASLKVTTGPANGTIAVNPDGTITYTPAANFSGTDSYVYEICDLGLPVACVTATATITVTPVNDPPAAVNDSALTPEDTPVTFSLTGNDSDPDGTINVSSVAIVSQPAHGTVTTNGDGTVTFTPDPNYHGTDTFEYQVCDNSTPALCSIAVATVTISSVNDIPKAADDNAVTPEDTPITIGVLANDGDIENGLDPSSVSVTTAPANGTFVINPDGTITFTPNAEFAGVDTFSYRVCDSAAPPACVIAVVEVTVIAINDAPLAQADNASTSEDSPKTISVVANDSDPESGLDLTSLKVTTPSSNGTVVVNPDGTVTYTPNPEFNGTDTFTYEICDQSSPALCSPAVVTVTVSGVNDPVVASPETLTTPQGANVVVPVLANDFDPDVNIDLSSLLVTAAPANGTLVVNPDGTISYQPNATFRGTDAFTYKICDTGSPVFCDTAIVTVTVEPVNHPPVAVPDTKPTQEDVAVDVVVASNDTDVDGNLVPTSVSVLAGPSHGTVSVLASGTLRYTPDANYTGTDVIVYQICDDGSPLPIYCSSTTATVTINPVNDMPLAAADSGETPEDTPITLNLAANDGDSDSVMNLASIALLSLPAHGTVAVNADGTVVYTPYANWNGTDSFSYEICDTGTPLPVNCVAAVATVVVVGINDAPNAVDDTKSTPEDTPVSVAVLGNDGDIDGGLDPATVSITNQPANGSVVVNADGTITYTPNENFNGTDTFRYQVCDVGSPVLCDVALVTSTIDPVNDPPVAANNANVTPEDTPVTVNLLANDSDLEGPLDPGSVVVTVDPANGTISVNPDGTVVYTPNKDWTGTDQFTYQVCDSGTPLPAQCVTAVAVVTVLPVNDSPVAQNDSVTTDEDAPIDIVVLGNDSDVEGPLDPASVLVTAAPAHGTITVKADGTVTYTPNANYSGTDTFTYQVCDQGTPALCVTAVVDITIVPANDSPIARDDSAITPEDTPVTFGVVGNDTDSDAEIDETTVTVLANPTNGTVSIDPVTGEATYTPNANFTGTDTFTYQVCDTGAPLPSKCTTAIATITVLPMNDPPVASPDATTTPEETPVDIDVLGNDSDLETTLDLATLAVTGAPLHGTVTMNADGTMTYTPAAGYVGTDTFTYVVCDSGSPLPALCTSAIATVTITPVNDAPMALADAETTPEDTPVVVQLLANDSDTDSTLNPTSVTILSAPAHGTVVIAVDGSVTYTPAPDWNGIDTFTYEVCDNGTPLPALCATAVATITVDPVNDPPVAVADAATTPEDTPVVMTLAPNDTDIDGNIVPTSISIVGVPTNGTVAVNADGTVTYTPAVNFTGTDTFTYQICDDGTPLPALCTTAIATVTIAAVNDPPTAVNDAATTPEDTPVVIAVVANDSDTDAAINPASVIVTNVPSNGTVVILADGTIRYTPNADFNGMDTFSYTVCDTGNPTPAKCAPADVVVTVTPVNDTPVAVDDAKTTFYETPVVVNVLANDSDTDATLDPLTVRVTLPPVNGTVVVNADGTVTYTPNAGYLGIDTFTYEVCDTGSPLPSLCVTAVATITIVESNASPVAAPDAAAAVGGKPVAIDVLANDSDPDRNIDPTSVRLIGTPPPGTLTIDPKTGVMTYTPPIDAKGTVTFTYEMCDTGNPVKCATAEVTVAVSPSNQPPVPVNDSATTLEDTAVSLSPLSNDMDPDANLDPSTIRIVSPTSNGSVTLNSDGTVTYVPNADYTGRDVFTYEVCDKGTPVFCRVAEGVIDITPVNDAPLAADDSSAVAPGGSVTLELLRNDRDPDGALDPTTVRLVSEPSKGTVTIDPATGALTYKATPGQSGTDVFRYTVCDSGSPVECVTATITIVIPVEARAPEATPDRATTPLSTTVTISVLTNDRAFGNPLDPSTLKIIEAPVHGTVNVLADGRINYTPTAGFVGTDTFRYEICDTLRNCAITTVTVEVTPVDRPIRALPDAGQGRAGSPVRLPLLGNDGGGGDSIDPATLRIVTQPANGSVVVDANGVATYTPKPGFVGVDTFLYEVCGRGEPKVCTTTTGTVTILAETPSTPAVDPLAATRTPGTGSGSVGRISGRLFVDVNQNGADDNEPGLADEKVVILGTGSDEKFETADDFRFELRTNDNGVFEKDDLPTGEYLVQVRGEVKQYELNGKAKRSVQVLGESVGNDLLFGYTPDVPSALSLTGSGARTLALAGVFLVFSGMSIVGAARRRRARNS